MIRPFAVPKDTASNIGVSSKKTISRKEPKSERADIQKILVYFNTFWFVIVLELSFEDLSTEMNEHPISLFGLPFDPTKI